MSRSILLASCLLLSACSTSLVTSNSPPVDPASSCLVIDSHPELAFRVQCQAPATLYLGFKEKGSTQRLDLKGRQVRLVISGTTELFNSDKEELRFQIYGTSDGQPDTRWLWLALDPDTPLDTLTIKAEVEGYALLTETLTSFEKPGDTDISRVVLELTPEF